MNDNNIMLIDYNENEISTIVNNFVEDHQTEEILNLISECEIRLNSNEATIGSLNERGFKHFINIIIGRDYRNKIKYRVNVQTIQRLQNKLYRALLQRLLKDEKLLNSLILREDQRDLKIFQQINSIKEQQKNANNQIAIQEWIQTIANAKNREGKLYSALPVEEQAFMIVSDYCSLCNFDDQEVLERRIGTVLDNLKIKNKEVDLIKFYKVILNSSERLYINEFYDRSDRIQKKHLSEVGEVIYNYPDFINTVYKQDHRDIKRDEIVNEYINSFAKKLEILDAKMTMGIGELLCDYIINDVLLVKNEISRIKHEDAIAEEEKRKRKEAEIQKKIEVERKLLEYRENAYIIKITPEGVYKLGPSCDETLISINVNSNKDHMITYDLKEYIAANVSSWTPVFIIIENIGQYTIDSTILDTIRRCKRFSIVSMPDYYMTLYSTFKDDIDAPYSNVIFSELYWHSLVFYGYSISRIRGKGFSQVFSDVTFHTSQLPGTIYKGLAERINMDDSIIYRTFAYPDKRVKKLNDKRFNTQYIDQHLEKKLIESPDTFWDVMEKLKKYIIHYN